MQREAFTSSFRLKSIRRFISMKPSNVKIQVHLYAGLSRYASVQAAGAPSRVEIAEGTTVGELLDHLGIPAVEVKLMFVNGVRAEADVALAEGDRVGFFPAVGGG